MKQQPIIKLWWRFYRVPLGLPGLRPGIYFLRWD